MNATITARTPTSFTVQVEVPYSDSMLDFEEALQQRLNDAGVVATAEGLRQFDTDGAPITVGPVKLTTKGPVEKDYPTPYGDNPHHEGRGEEVSPHPLRAPRGAPPRLPGPQGRTDLLPARPRRPDH